MPDLKSQRRWLCLILTVGIQVRAELPSFAFYYGVNPPLEELSAFDQVIVDPGFLASPPRAQDTAGEGNPQWLAYVALGEVNPSRDYYGRIPKAWFLGKNVVWGSAVLDQTPDSWPDFFLAHVITPLWKKGYRGFFLDALDSYQLYVTDPQGRARQAAGMAAVIHRLKKAYPGIRLVLNRGFEMLPEVHGEISAVVFESLFQRWDQAAGKYMEVPEEDRIILLEIARKIIKDYRLPVVSIDYVSPDDRQLARSTAERIKGVGLVPWVSSPGLDMLGVGSVEVQPRKILMLFDGAENHDLSQLAIHRNADPMLTYLGYVTEFRDISQPPPSYPLQGRYAGILCWTDPGSRPASLEMGKWLVSQMAQGVKMVFWGQLPFPAKGPFLEAFGLKAGRANKRDSSARVVMEKPVMHFEMEPLPDARLFHPLRIREGDVLLRLTSALGDTMEAAAYAPWGGYVLAPFVLRDLPVRNSQRWVVQPMEFLAKALRLPVLPAPDLTTENGTRLLMVHVDGDGFANRADWVPHPFAGEVLKQEILDKYPLATTFSIIEGEVSDEGMYPDIAAMLRPIARSILALPHVEIASHSYSHPFDWERFAAGGKDGRENHLDIKGFRFGPKLMEREIAGSIGYINRELAPAGKTCKVYLWSGNCNPDGKTIGLAYAAGVANMNGGETVITAASDSWTNIAPIGIVKEGNFQVYAPTQNENMYTGEWKGPFYGYQNVIETFERTDRPFRFKPVDIYYHSYSGSKQASLHALKKVYDWAMRQDLYNLFVSEYVPKATDFMGISMTRSGQAWVIKGARHLREFRIPSAMGYPDLARSKGVAGYSEAGGYSGVPANRYIHTTGRDVELILSPNSPTQPFLWSANGALTSWTPVGKAFSMTLAGNLNLSFVLAGVVACKVLADGKPLTGKPGPKGSLAFRLSVKKSEIEVICP